MSPLPQEGTVLEWRDFGDGFADSTRCRGFYLSACQHSRSEEWHWHVQVQSGGDVKGTAPTMLAAQLSAEAAALAMACEVVAALAPNFHSAVSAGPANVAVSLSRGAVTFMNRDEATTLGIALIACANAALLKASEEPAGTPPRGSSR